MVFNKTKFAIYCLVTCANALTMMAMSKLENSALVEIQQINPKIAVDVIYATDKNFTGKIIYKSSKCCLHKDIAQVLSNVEKELEQKGLGLLVWDAYRPMSAQQKLWDVCAAQYPDENERENYVSNPKKGGRHTRARTVDVTLVDLKTGKLLEMPSEFDHFGPKAWRDYNGPELSEQAKKNRQLLEEVMHKHGFKGLQSEWWHFDYQDWQNYPPLDIEI